MRWMDGQAVCSAEAGSGRHSFGTYHRYEVLAPSLMHWGFNQSLLHLVLVPAHHGCDSEIGSMTCLGFSVMQRLLLLHHNEQPLNCRMVPGSSKHSTSLILPWALMACAMQAMRMA